jgi:pimeloyl-ACP methyl ester carboxylesterase
MKSMLGLVAVTLMATASPLQAAAPEKPVSIVLVHGAFVDGSGWKAVYDALSNDGYEVLVVQNPTITLEGDAEATRQVIARAKHPVVLVGHSYGGAVITLAGDNPKVQSLVYLAAYAPDIGESVFDLATRPHPGEESAPLLPPADGYLRVDPAKFPTSFAADVDGATARFMADAQVPWGLGAVQYKQTKPAWKVKPVHYMLTLGDHMIPPSLQRRMALRTKGKIVEVQSSHAVMLSHPDKVVEFIEAAVPAK